MSSKLIKTDETYRSWIREVVSQLPDAEIAQQDVSQIPAADEVFRIPWGHMIQIMNKSGGDREQLGTYVVAVNHQLKTEYDNPTLGLLVCKDPDKVEAQYALESSSQPLGISRYELTRLIPEDFKGSMPTIEEIEAELSDPEGGQDV